MINYIMKDFRSVRDALSWAFGRKIPFGIALLYYIIVGAIFLPLMPFIKLFGMIWYKIQIRKLEKYWKA